MNPAAAPPPKPRRPFGFGLIHALVETLKSRVVSGLILALPIALTFWIIYQLYLVLNNAILDPATRLVRYLLHFQPNLAEDSTWTRFVSPVIALGLVVGLLYLLGLFFRSWVHRAIDWVLLHLPIVTTIYRAVSNVFQSIDLQRHGNSFQRVVLVPFPHPGSKALAFVTRSLRDAATDRAIVCVCVLTGVVPPSGFTLYVFEDDVIDVDWSVNQALQAILSGGITTPSVIHFSTGLKVPPTGPIVDPSGHPIAGPEGALR